MLCGSLLGRNYLHSQIENTKKYLDKHIDLYYLVCTSNNSNNSIKTLSEFKKLVEKEINKTVTVKKNPKYKGYTIIRKPLAKKNKPVYYYYFIMVWCKSEKKPYFIRLGKEIPTISIIDKIVVEYFLKYPNRVDKLGFSEILKEIEI
jgi:hypothetical protein